jgi:hypothetical protein
MVLESLENMDALSLSFLKNKAKEKKNYLKNWELGLKWNLRIFLTNFK